MVGVRGEEINMKLSTTVVIYVFAHASNKTRKAKQKKKKCSEKTIF